MFILALTTIKLLIYSVLTSLPVSAALCKWDCDWYLSIAKSGYDAAPHQIGDLWQANWAFFPLYPLLVRSFGVIVDSSALETIGVALSTACFILFAVLSVRYRSLTRQSVSRWSWFILLTVWPYGFYFHSGYPEALYAALSTGAMLALADSKPFVAGWSTALLSATRPTGILLAAGLGLHQAMTASRPLKLRAILRILLPAGIGALGLVAFMGFLYARFGDPVAFATIQSGWRHHFANPIGVVAAGFSDISVARHHAGKAYDSVWALLGVAAAVWLLARRRILEGWFCGATVVVACTLGGLDSTPRYVAANPVFLFAAGDLLDRVHARGLRLALILGLAFLQVVLVRYWFRGANFLI